MPPPPPSPSKCRVVKSFGSSALALILSKIWQKPCFPQQVYTMHGIVFTNIMHMRAETIHDGCNDMHTDLPYLAYACKFTDKCMQAAKHPNMRAVLGRQRNAGRGAPSIKLIAGGENPIQFFWSHLCFSLWSIGVYGRCQMDLLCHRPHRDRPEHV